MPSESMHNMHMLCSPKLLSIHTGLLLPTPRQPLHCADMELHRSVATRKRPCTDTPAPPPMQMPSISAMCGFFSCPKQWFSMYSSRKNLRHLPAAHSALLLPGQAVASETVTTS